MWDAITAALDEIVATRWGIGRAYVWLLVGGALAVLVHEAGHAAMAALVGLSPRRMVVGRGPIVLRLRLGAMWLILRLLPVTGHVAILPLPAGRRLAWMAVIAGGTLGNAAALAAMAALWAARILPGTVLLPLGLMSCVFGLAALMPLPQTLNGVRRGSDGRQLWRALLGTWQPGLAAAYAAILRATTAPDGPLPAPSPHAAEIVYQCTRPDRMLDSWAARDASDCLRALLRHRTRLPPAEKALVLGFLASNELLFGGTGASAAEMDAWSAEAYALAPAPAIQVTRGAVLVATGQARDGTALLQQALPAAKPPDALIAAAFLCVAAQALGDAAAATRWRIQARAEVPANNPVLRVMIERIVAPARP